MALLVDQTGFGKPPAAPHRCQDNAILFGKRSEALAILVIRFRPRSKFDVPAYSTAIARGHAGCSKPPHVKRIQMLLLAPQICKMRLNADLEVQIVDLRDRGRSALGIDDLGAGQRINSQTLPAHP